MSAKTQWRVYDASGEPHWPPAVVRDGDWFSCGRGGSYATARRAVTAWALAESIDVAEVVAPDGLSAEEREQAMHERCIKACDDLFGKLEEGAESDDDTEVTMVVDDAHGTDIEEWDAFQCEEALEGVRAALSAVDLVTAGAP